jgi:hypothetical protein
LWSDDTRAVLVRQPRATTPLPASHATLVLRWFDGRTKELPSAPEPYPALFSGRYLTYTNIRVDLETGETTELSSKPVSIRTDGAVLFDGGISEASVPTDMKALLEDKRVLPQGPLRWNR